MKHILIYSHGLGVQKDDRGLFTDISKAFPDARSIMFDYNTVNELAHELTVSPLGIQANKLNEVITQTQEKNPGASIDVICHSQGCVVAAIAKPQGVHKIIFLAPPSEINVELFMKTFGNRPGSIVNLKGVSRLSRRDGSTTLVPSTYWSSIKGLDTGRLYNELSNSAQIIIVNAVQDEVLGRVVFNNLSSKITIYELEAGHDFTDEARTQVVRLLVGELEDSNECGCDDRQVDSS
jgi:hypothetical protein